jgi:hypothetical protein
VATDPSESANALAGFVISDYPNLTALVFPALEIIGSNLVLTRNQQLGNVTGFQNLSTVNGNIDITGNLQSVVMPSLKNVTGSINIQSTMSNFQCPITDGVVHGSSFVCEGGVANPVPLAADNSTTNTSDVVVPSSSAPSSSAPSITVSTETPSASATGSSQKSSASVTMAYGSLRWE